MKNPDIIHWRLPSEKPIAGSRVIIETLDGDYVEEEISNDEVFDTWNEAVIRWAFSPHWLNIERKVNFADKMNPPKDDEKEEENDKKLQKEIMDAMLYGSLLWFILSDDSYSNAKCRECCCDGFNDSQDDKMDELRSGMSKSDKDKDKGTSNEEDSFKPESVSDEELYVRLRNSFYYDRAGAKGPKGEVYSRRDAILSTLVYAPELKEVARKIDPWYFND